MTVQTSESQLQEKAEGNILVADPLPLATTEERIFRHSRKPEAQKAGQEAIVPFALNYKTSGKGLEIRSVADRTWTAIGYGGAPEPYAYAIVDD